MNPPLYILSGGRSRRFGSDKARAIRRGIPLIRGVAEALSGATLGAVVVAEEAGRYDDLGLETIGDLVPQQGPLGGLATALDDLGRRHPDEPRLLLAACDLIDPDPSWVALLADAMGEAPAAAFKAPGGWEPVFALYSQVLAAEAEHRLAGEERSLHSLLDAVGAAAVPVPDGFRHVSTPDDLAALS